MGKDTAVTKRMKVQGAPVLPVLLTREPLDPAAVERSVERPQAGAVVAFVGTTRNVHAGKAVLHLEYEAQETLARKALEALCAEATEKFGLSAAAVHHRLGKLEIGEASVAIAVSAPHRGPAFEGCRYLIDTLKTSIPIFKKEHYADGSAPEWVGPDGKPVRL